VKWKEWEEKEEGKTLGGWNCFTNGKKTQKSEFNEPRWAFQDFFFTHFPRLLVLFYNLPELHKHTDSLSLNVNRSLLSTHPCHFYFLSGVSLFFSVFQFFSRKCSNCFLPSGHFNVVFQKNCVRTSRRILSLSHSLKWVNICGNKIIFCRGATAWK
jgi:hypothetical protein